MTIHMVLKDGTHYTLDREGYVLDRSDGPRGWNYAQGWRILGFLTRFNSRHLIPLEEALSRHRLGIPDAGKHGATCGHGFVVDWDHGTRRVWGSPNGHRLKSLWLEGYTPIRERSQYPMSQPAIRYKLTDDRGMTHNYTLWGPDTPTHTTNGEWDLCGPGWLHCYDDPLVAVLLNPIHADFPPDSMRLAEVECSGKQRTDYGRKEGWTEMRWRAWLPVPQVTITQRVAFAILCAQEVYNNPTWRVWSDNWLAGSDRSQNAANTAANAANSSYAAYAANAAVYAVNASYAANAANAANAAVYAANAAVQAANAANASYAAHTAYDIDLKDLARRAMEY